MRMAVNIHERFLRYSENCHGNSLLDRRSVAQAPEGGVNSGSSAETESERLQCRGQCAVSEFDGIMEKGERPYFPVDLAHRLLNLFEQVLVSAILLDLLEMCDAELKSDEELPGRVVQFLGEMLPLILPNSQQFIKHVSRRNLELFGMIFPPECWSRHALVGCRRIAWELTRLES